MPTEQQENGSTGETQDQEQQDQQQQTTPETGANGSQQQVEITDDTQLPETHKLVKALAALKTKNASQATELAEARASAGKATKLQEELDARPTAEALATLQTRYDRLEAFLIAAGGPISKALDSRTFTKALFESEKVDIDELVKQWHKDNPSATAAALGGGGPEGQGKPKHDPNDLIRAAFKGSRS
ncbi:scaffolding protein [Microbacterium phage Redfield]|uniref:Scaffolding protein n=5 Tax=Ilzatvirus hamlet TaxID=2560591 RepID=A0A345MEH4_9CAUD|nr:scaffolding protein [Microbacterium phage Peppino]AVR56091.1 scaffolding protein [Microbacterium phage BeeBee8]AVR56270.1 scaffolding protein [Microbacterium phage Etna]AXH46395.1 scaffolding protein [Microbacterium phage Redfield]AXH68955.1 scaffolding protein [Microbacterium phage Schnapsidee]QYW01467.1 scaffolding protein [Microbacterium phage Stormbreaker8]